MGGGATADGYGVCFGGNQNVPKLIVVMAVQSMNILKLHCRIHFKCVDRMVCEIYLKLLKKASSDWVLGNFKSTHFTAILPVTHGESLNY